MTGEDLINSLRYDILDDVAEPYLWSTAFLLRCCNLAEAQACRRAHLIIDGNTGKDSGTSGTAGTAGGGVADLCSVTLIPNVWTYTLSRLVIQIKRVKLATMANPLTPVTRDELDELWSSWESVSGTAGTAGTAGGDGPVYPEYFIAELGNELTLVKGPTINDTASLIVSRLPLMQFTLSTSPEVAERHHDGLLYWAAHLAYMKSDTETSNLNLAAVYEKKFTDRFGPMPDAYSEKMRRELPRRQRMRPRAFGS